MRNINVTKLESRPVPAGLKAPEGLNWLMGGPQVWEYLFYLDFEIPAHYDDKKKKLLWENLSEFSIWRRSLGFILHNSEMLRRRLLHGKTFVISFLCDFFFFFFEMMISNVSFFFLLRR